MLRRNKIVATVGPATDDPHIMDELIRSGMDVARVNFSHGDFETHQRCVTTIREHAHLQGRHVAIMLDLQVPKMRIEGFRGGSVELEEDQSFVLDLKLGTKDDDEHQQRPAHFCPVPADLDPTQGDFISRRVPHLF